MSNRLPIDWPALAVGQRVWIGQGLVTPEMRQAGVERGTVLALGITYVEFLDRYGPALGLTEGQLFKLLDDAEAAGADVNERRAAVRTDPIPGAPGGMPLWLRAELLAPVGAEHVELLRQLAQQN